MIKVKNCVILFMVSICIVVSTTLTIMAKENDLKYLDVDLKSLSVSGHLSNKESVPGEIKAINRINKKYNKLSKKDKCGVFLIGLFQASLQNRELFEKLKKDFSLDSVPSSETKHKYFDFKKSEILTTKDFKMYNKFFKWNPKGKLVPYKIDMYNLRIYFLDESMNFSYVAEFKFGDKSKKIEIITFTSNYYPLTPYIFFAGYMGYPDIPEASPDYK